MIGNKKMGCRSDHLLRTLVYRFWFATDGMMERFSDMMIGCSTGSCHLILELRFRSQLKVCCDDLIVDNRKWEGLMQEVYVF